MKNLDLAKEEVIKCFHCGNETIMSQKGNRLWVYHIRKEKGGYDHGICNIK